MLTASPLLSRLTRCVTHVALPFQHFLAPGDYKIAAQLRRTHRVPLSVHDFGIKQP